MLFMSFVCASLFRYADFILPRKTLWFMDVTVSFQPEVLHEVLIFVPLQVHGLK